MISLDNKSLNDKHDESYVESYQFHNRAFCCLKKLVEILTNETSSIIENMEKGKLENTPFNRNQVTWRLKRIYKYTLDEFTEFNKFYYNELWHRLYILEHLEGFTHPFLKKLKAKKICAVQPVHSY